MSGLLAMYLAALETEEDRTLFMRLHSANEKKLYAVAFHILGNAAQAEDAMQQTWLQVLDHWDRIKALGRTAADAYVVTVAKNAALDIRRGSRRTVPLPEDWDPPAPADSAGDYARLVALILALPEGYRQILELKFVQEETNRSIARRLGIKESTVASRVQRGRALLLKALAKEGYVHA